MSDDSRKKFIEASNAGVKVTRIEKAQYKRNRPLNLAEFHRLRAQGASKHVIAKALGTTPTQVKYIIDGTHWQLNPEKVAKYNHVNNQNLDLETGQPPDSFFKKEVTEEEKLAEELPDVIDTHFFQKEVDKKLAQLLHYLTPEKMRDATVRELSTSISSLFEKRALLRGEPTMVISHEHRAKLNELMPLLIAEAQRRGMAFPVLEGKAKVVKDD